MADSGLFVTISGAALSLLIYENVRSAGDQMGFLLGDIVEYVVKKYTDSDNQIKTVKIHVDVKTVVTCSMLDSLYDSTGKINEENLKDFTRDKGKQVIGWFRFRRNMDLVPTLRDKILHKQFSSHFFENFDNQYFVMCLLSSSMSNMHGTHKFKHVFLRHNRGAFEPIPLRINNLGDDASRHDGSDYKPIPHTTLLNTHGPVDTFSKMVESLNLDLTQSSGLEPAIIIQKEAEKYLNSLIPKVCDSDREVAELEKQVRELREKIFERKWTNRVKVNGNSNIESTREPMQNSADEECLLSDRNERLLQRKNTLGKVFYNDLQFKHNTTTPSQQNTYKTTSTVATLLKNINQEKSRRVELETEMQASQNHDPFANIVVDARLELSEGVTNKNRCSTSLVSEIARQPIRIEQSDVGAGRGSPKFIHEVSLMKKSRRSTGLINPRCNTTIRHSMNQSPEYETSETNSKQNQWPMAYAQAVKGNTDVRTCDLSESSDIP